MSLMKAVFDRFITFLKDHEDRIFPTLKKLTRIALIISFIMPLVTVITFIAAGWNMLGVFLLFFTVMYIHFPAGIAIGLIALYRRYTKQDAWSYIRSETKLLLYSFGLYILLYVIFMLYALLELAPANSE